MAIKAQLSKDGKTLTITCDVNKELVPSSSGKTLLVASTGPAIVTDQIINGKPIIIGLNAYIKRDKNGMVASGE